MSAGRLGENVTTAGVDLLGHPTGTLLRLGEEAVLEVTGLRNPCVKINDLRQGLLGEVFALDPVSGEFTFTSGVMAVVRAGDTVEVEVAPPPHRTLEGRPDRTEHRPRPCGRRSARAVPRNGLQVRFSSGC